MNKKIIIGASILLVIVVLVAVNLARSNGAAPAFGTGKTYSVKVERVQKGEISANFSASGVVEEIEKSEVYFETLLRVEKIFVEKNQAVSKGQQIMQLDIDVLESELEALEIEKKKQELSLASENMSNEVKSAKNALESAQRAYDTSKKEYDNKTDLYAAGAISKDELESAESAVKDAEDTLENAKLSYETALSSVSIDVGIKQLNLDTTQLNISDLQKKIKKITEYMYSPIDGAVAELNIVEGSYTGSSQPVYTVINPDKLQVKALVNEYNIKTVKEEQKVIITGDAIDEDKEVTGKVKSISPLAVKNSTSDGEEVVVQVTVVLDKSDVELKPGLNVTCDIFTEAKNGVVVVPMEMIMEDKDGNKFVYVVDEEKNTMLKREVKLGVFSDMTVEVLDGINEGELVILNPQPIYTDGAGVKIMNPGMK